MKANLPKAFLTHSGIDKSFVRFLDASLVYAGVETFFDERDIRIGDSIPSKIYTGIESSNYLIYVISSNSVKSLWVEEELSIAKIREKSGAGIRVLPILIDDVELPTSVSHVKYADFRKWKDPGDYRKSVLQILEAMNIVPKLVGNADVRWQIVNYYEIKRSMRVILETSARIRTAIDSAQYYSNDPSSTYYRRVIKCVQMRECEDVLNCLEILERITSISGAETSASLARTRELVLQALSFIVNIDLSQLENYSNRNGVARTEDFANLLFHVWSALDEISTNSHLVFQSIVSDGT